jgi:hypothetical protein
MNISTGNLNIYKMMTSVRCNFLPKIIRVIKSRRIGWEEHVEPNADVNDYSEFS